jgi:hypothetical protein
VHFQPLRNWTSLTPSRNPSRPLFFPTGKVRLAQFRGGVAACSFIAHYLLLSWKTTSGCAMLERWEHKSPI